MGSSSIKGFSDDELRKRLTPEQYRVAVEKGTEAPFSGVYAETKDAGMYRCAVCGAELFDSDTKFDSGSGWPSFTSPKESSAVTLAPDRSYGMDRTEVVCSKCGAHLGHMFDDGPRDAGGKRYCINSVCLDLEKKNSSPDHA